MLILIRHDGTAQVVIHTANMIAFDWANMTQALWKSPLLPLIPQNSPPPQGSNRIGSGQKFKTDLLNYLRAYDTKRTICKSLIEQLSKYDFSDIRAALVASVPGKQSIETDSETAWGWAGLKRVLDSVPARSEEPEIVIQISSIATLGQNDKWLDKCFFKALSTSKNPATSKPKFMVIFPTADEIRRSLNGYASGGAIHTKIKSAAQIKQLRYLKPLLCHWAGDGAQHASSMVLSSTDNIHSQGSDNFTDPPPQSDAGRKRAAPHIKTFTRFSDVTRSTIDWMLVTSANLSKQAWGDATNTAGDIRICSYEIGVMIWPDLFGEKAVLVPTFQRDTPPAGGSNEVVVGARMPYDLPLVPYGAEDVPWCATSSYNEPDWMGETYGV